jgi:hypothetical protein
MAQPLLKVYKFLVHKKLGVASAPPGDLCVASDTQANAQKQLGLYLATTYPAGGYYIHSGGVLVIDNVINNEG